MSKAEEGCLSPSDDERYATFWSGPLSPYELSIFASYRKLGQPLTVYSFESSIVNEDVHFSGADASSVLSASLLDTFKYNGRPDIRHYSDLFRLELSRKTGEIWVDADMLSLRKPDRKLPPLVLCREWKPSICNSVLRIPPADVRLSEMIGACKKLSGQELRWGQTGPHLLTKFFSDELRSGKTLEPERFYPLDYPVFFKALLPEFRHDCEQATSQAWGMHLWNNIIEEIGIVKLIAPPAGSFLHEQFRRCETLSLFSDVYPDSAMRATIRNYHLRKSGDDLGIRAVTRQLIPSVKRTFRHYRGA